MFDVVSLVNTARSSFYYIDLFYIIVAIVSTVLSFFLILVSFVSNVRENSWEFGVLRAIGLDKVFKYIFIFLVLNY
jgi:ABC-type antimicrobial peptide transport system permease subunit